MKKCNHNYFSSMKVTKKGIELHCSNCDFNYGLVGHKSIPTLSEDCEQK